MLASTRSHYPSLSLPLRASRNCALTLPAETAITIDCTAPISSSVSPSSLATPKYDFIQGSQPTAMAVARWSISVVFGSRTSLLRADRENAPKARFCSRGSIAVSLSRGVTGYAALPSRRSRQQPRDVNPSSSSSTARTTSSRLRVGITSRTHL